jgi:hypothetical protein
MFTCHAISASMNGSAISNQQLSLACVLSLIMMFYFALDLESKSL